MQMYAVAHKINDISNVLPCSLEEQSEIKELAFQKTKEYLLKLKKTEERFPLDVALSTVYLSSNEIGCRITYSELSKNTGYPLSTWTKIVQDIIVRTR